MLPQTGVVGTDMNVSAYNKMIDIARRLPPGAKRDDIWKRLTSQIT